MNFQNLLNQFTGSSSHVSSNQQSPQSSGLGKGLLGGAAAGGVMGLLVSNKKARKFAGKAATVGGAALLGGIAFKAYKNWQQNNQQTSPSISQPNSSPDALYSPRQIRARNAVPHQSFQAQNTTPEISEEFQLTLIKAMIAAAKSDGHIDEAEQKRIFDAVHQMPLSRDMKGLVFDLLRQPIYIEELAHGAQSMEQKSEVYLASCIAIDLDTAAEQDYLDKLASVLDIPLSLTEQIQSHAKQALGDDRVLN